MGLLTDSLAFIGNQSFSPAGKHNVTDIPETSERLTAIQK